MYDTILVPIDGSTAGETAVIRALEIAQTFDASIHALHVLDSGGPPPGIDTAAADTLHYPSEKQGRGAVADADERASDLGLGVTTVVAEGVPHRTILEYAGEHDVDLIVMGTHGLTGPDRVRLGSTTERVITLANPPVLAVPTAVGRDHGGDADVESDTVGPWVQRIIIATDGSDAAERAADRGFEFAELYGADVYATYVLDQTIYDLEDAPRSTIGMLREGGQHAVDTVAENGRERGLSVATDVLRGVPEEELLEYAQGVGGDLIVMGTRGGGGATGDVLGSTIARVLRRTEFPLLTVG